MAKMIAKVQVTSACNDWWESELEDVLDIRKVQIISAVIDNGGLYLIYIYDSEEND